jgi:hypothetical protein
MPETVLKFMESKRKEEREGGERSKGTDERSGDIIMPYGD